MSVVRFRPWAPFKSSKNSEFISAISYIQAFYRVRSSAFGACACWLSQSEEKTVAHDAIENSEALGGCQGATIAKALMAEHAEWKESLKALAPLFSPEKVTAALLVAKHGTDTEEAFEWFRNAGFTPNDLDVDGKAVF